MHPGNQCRCQLSDLQSRVEHSLPEANDQPRLLARLQRQPSGARVQLVSRLLLDQLHQTSWHRQATSVLTIGHYRRQLRKLLADSRKDGLMQGIQGDQRLRIRHVSSCSKTCRNCCSKSRDSERSFSR
nr:MAG TPA: hypothetical protein [Caudoviricetes sp.]